MLDKIEGYATLGDAGRELYDELHADFDFSSAEELMCLEACAMVDTIRELEVARSRGTWVPSPTGRAEVLNPAFAELRMYRSQLMTLLKKLGVLEDLRGAHMTQEQARRNALGRNF